MPVFDRIHSLNIFQWSEISLSAKVGTQYVLFLQGVFLENCQGVPSHVGEVSACHPPATVPRDWFELEPVSAYTSKATAKEERCKYPDM